MRCDPWSTPETKISILEHLCWELSVCLKTSPQSVVLTPHLLTLNTATRPVNVFPPLQTIHKPRTLCLLSPYNTQLSISTRLDFSTNKRHFGFITDICIRKSFLLPASRLLTVFM